MAAWNTGMSGMKFVTQSVVVVVVVGVVVVAAGVAVVGSEYWQCC